MFYHCHEVRIPCIVGLSLLYKPFILLFKRGKFYKINPLKTELNPICHLLALLEAHHILHVSRVRVKVGSFCYMLLLVINIL